MHELLICFGGIGNIVSLTAVAVAGAGTVLVGVVMVSETGNGGESAGTF